MTMATMRYLVDDVAVATAFYTELLDFEVVERYGPAIAIVRRGDLDLWLAGPPSSAARPMPDGRSPEPGGWNRAVVVVDDLAAEVDRLRDAGASFRNDIVDGPGGRQILVEDPAGNVIELFQPA
jgi:catechol 2,3-dioxygenase-like lactoylglutathione lyase family enzyme